MTETRVVYLSPGEITIRSVALPELKPNQVLVKTHRASVCGSERYAYLGLSVRPEDRPKGGPETKLGEHTDKHSGEGGEYPMGPLGHEGGGTILEMGSGVEEYLGGGTVSEGDRVGSLFKILKASTLG